MRPPPCGVADARRLNPGCNFPPALRAGFFRKRQACSYFGGNTAIASTSNSAPGRASCGTPIAVLAGGATLFT
jgi:hypothetical protein